MSTLPRLAVVGFVLTVALGASPSPSHAGFIYHEQVATVAGDALVGTRVVSAFGQEIISGSDSATDTSSKILQFPGFNTDLGQLDSVDWSVDYFGRTSTDIYAGCEVSKGLPFLGCRVDAETNVELRSLVRVVEQSSPGVFNFETLLRGSSLATVAITSTNDLITCAILGGNNGPCADISGDTSADSSRLNRSEARDAYLRDTIPVLVDGELFADLSARCTGISVLAVCGASSETSGDATFRIGLEYAYTPTRTPTPVPIGSTLPIVVLGIVAMAGLRRRRLSRA